ncbi:AAA family ATPase [Devosia sp. A369]
MSFSSRLSSTTLDDGDDVPSTEITPVLPTERTSDALARCMLDAVLTPRLRRLLKVPSRLILIRTADEAAARLLERYLGGLDRAPVVEAYTEPQKTGARLEPHGRAELSKLERGKSVILISQDPERVIVPEALAAADAVITVPHPNLAAIRKTIRAVTGGIVRGLVLSDVEGLGILDFITAIRPGLSARECIGNLRRAALFRREPPQYAAAIPLEKLAMTGAVSAWAFETLRITRQVTGGKVDVTALRYACLEGPPGTGKTTVAASLAQSAGWAFVSTSVGGWFASSGGHLGDVIRAARRFFDELALAKGPVVGLLDEIDALPNRATMDPEDASWWTPVITFVLTEIDRLRKSGRPVLLLAATNHFNHLDAALVRPGRLERQVSVLPPNETERRAMFATCLGGRIGADGLSTLARLSVLATPAKVESWCLSAIAAAEVEDRALQLRDLVDLIAPPSGRSAKKDRSVALHEAGHAIVAHELGLPVAEISILGMGDAAGWVNTRLEDRLLTRDDMEHIASMMLAGRAADMVLGGGADAGAASDLESVNKLLRAAMLDLGLYGPLTTAANSDLRNWQNDGVTLWSTIGDEINRLYDRATDIVSRRRGDIFKLVEVLLVERVVTGDRLTEILAADAIEDTSDGPAQPVGRP